MVNSTRSSRTRRTQTSTTCPSLDHVFDPVDGVLAELRDVDHSRDFLPDIEDCSSDGGFNDFAC